MQRTGIDAAQRAWMQRTGIDAAQRAWMQRTGIDAAQRAWMQARVESLHKMAGRTSRWIKARGAAAEGLAAVDPASLVTPPAGRGTRLVTWVTGAG
eukprot:gene12785-59813_t